MKIKILPFLGDRDKVELPFRYTKKVVVLLLFTQTTVFG